MTPAQRAYEPAASDARALRRLSTELSRRAGGQVDAEGVGTYADAPLNRGDKGTRADQVITARSRDVLDRAVAEMVRRGYALLGVREDDGEWWAWLAGGEEAKRGEREAAGATKAGDRGGRKDAPVESERHARREASCGDLAREGVHPLRNQRRWSSRSSERGPCATQEAVAEGLTRRRNRSRRPPIRGHAGPGPPGFRASAVTPYAVASSDPVDALCGFVWGGVGDG